MKSSFQNLYRFTQQNKRLLTIAVACILVSVVMFQFDEAIMTFIKLPSSAYLAPVRMVTEFGLGITQVMIFLMLLAVYEEYEIALTGIISLIVVGVLTVAFKHLFGIPGPDTLQPCYPSGHTATAFTAAVLLAGRYPRFKYPFYFLATAVGVSRILLRHHFPSDVFAGAALGLVVGAAVVFTYGKPRLLVEPKRLRRIAVVLLIALCVYSLFGSDAPKYLMSNVAPVVLLLLVRKMAVGIEGKRICERISSE